MNTLILSFRNIVKIWELRVYPSAIALRPFKFSLEGVRRAEDAGVIRRRKAKAIIDL